MKHHCSEAQRIADNAIRWYDRQGNPLKDLQGVEKLLTDEEYRIVKQEPVNGYFVSTVWLGLDHAHILNRGQVKPVIFETMIFIIQKDKNSSAKTTTYQERYCTEEEALLGHTRALEVALKGNLEVLD